MKPSEVTSCLNVALACHIPAMIWGPAGAGKSEVVAQVAKQRRVELRDVRLANLDPTDIKGFPVPNAAKKVMTWLPAEFMPTAGKGILFFDELNLADKMTQASCYQLMLTREVGSYKLPPGWDIVAAGNRDTDRGNVVRMAGPLANRLIHLDFEPDLDEWVTHARNSGIDEALIAFLRFRPLLLHSFDAQSKEPAFPSPRTWFFVDAVLKQKPSPATTLGLVNGTVGKAAAIELIGFLDHMHELPDIDEVLAAPARATVPPSPSAKYAITNMLGSQVTEATFAKMLAYMERLPQELGVVFVRDAGITCPKVRLTPAYSAWAAKNHDVVR